jgi:hypothetical protein
VPIGLGRLEFVRSETRRPVHYVMGIVKFPVEGRNPPFGKQLFPKVWDPGSGVRMSS